MANISALEPRERLADLHELGRQIALLIWNDDEGAALFEDPRDPAFSAGVMAGLSLAMVKAPGLMRKVVRHAAAAAEDLNVEAFQGIVEVLQNADRLYCLRKGAVALQGRSADLSREEIRLAYFGM